MIIWFILFKCVIVVVAASALVAQSKNLKKQTLKFEFSTTRYLPLPASENADVLKKEKTALKLLRKKAEADNLFALAKEGLANADSQEGLGQAMSSAARLLFGHGESLLFIPSIPVP